MNCRAPEEGGYLFRYLYDLPPGQPATNLMRDERQVDVFDMREVEGGFNLRDNGVQLCSFPGVPEDIDWSDEQQVGHDCTASSFHCDGKAIGRGGGGACFRECSKEDTWYIRPEPGMSMRRLEMPAYEQAASPQLPLSIRSPQSILHVFAH